MVLAQKCSFPKPAFYFIIRPISLLALFLEADLIVSYDGTNLWITAILAACMIV